MNTEKDFSPLTPNIVRALNDKLYEKRKVAALEIEKLVREFVAQLCSDQTCHPDTGHRVCSVPAPSQQKRRPHWAGGLLHCLGKRFGIVPEGAH